MPDKSITTQLLAVSAVTDIVGTRIRPGMLDDADAQPGIVVERTTKRPVNHAGGKTDTRFANVAVGCTASTYPAAIALADLVEAALNGWTNTGGTPAISMVHVDDVSYSPGGVVPGKDELWERFVVDCSVTYSE